MKSIPPPANFNPRFPRGKRQVSFKTKRRYHIFQSTLPAREATPDHSSGVRGLKDFNPRFPRGKRHKTALETLREIHFNPRFPRGKRRSSCASSRSLPEFQSTLPAGEATKVVAGTPIDAIISIHASRGGSDPVTTIKSACAGQFQSTLPAGEATFFIVSYYGKDGFQSTLPAGEATISALLRQ